MFDQNLCASVPLRIESRNRMEIAKKLRDQGVITEFIYNDKWKLGKQLQYASEAGKSAPLL